MLLDSQSLIKNKLEIYPEGYFEPLLNKEIHSFGVSLLV